MAPSTDEHKPVYIGIVTDNKCKDSKQNNSYK